MKNIARGIGIILGLLIGLLATHALPIPGCNKSTPCQPAPCERLPIPGCDKSTPCKPC